MPKVRIQESPPGPAYALVVTGIVRDRAASELVNMIIGIIGGIQLLFPPESLYLSRALWPLLEIAPESFWGGVLLLWGGFTALTWLCPSWVRCRTWGMLLSIWVWAALAGVAAMATDGRSVMVVLFASQAAGCWVTFLRLYRVRTHGV